MKSFWHDLPHPFFVLAPMEAVTDIVFRQVIAQAGAPDVWYTEFMNATGWAHAGQKAVGGRLVKHPNEHPIVAQIWGGEPDDMAQFAAHCRDAGFDGIDINMGCPAKSAIKSGGAALIRKPDIAVQAITAAKTAGLPVSVKTRLGYTHVDEWRKWLTTLLQQDIVTLTIHLRTKKEMSKVPAHYELIDDIIKLRDEIAPHTLLVINGDIRDRAHGLELATKHPGVNGIMIGRGVFQNPRCFAEIEQQPPLVEDSAFPAGARQERQLSQVAPSGSETRGVCCEDDECRANLNLLQLHLSLYDQYHEQTGRPYETLKRYFKIYVRDFDGAGDLRTKLMQTKNTDEARALLANYL